MENMMKATTSVAAALGVAAACCLSCAAFAAGKYDGSAPLVCAVLVVHECSVGDICVPRNAASVGLSPILKVDPKAMKIRNLDSGKSPESTIKSVEHVNNKMVLSGGEVGRGWAISIHEDNGRFSAAVTADDAGFVIFGQCALP
jgi:hypothetical protein